MKFSRENLTKLEAEEIRKITPIRKETIDYIFSH